VNRSFFLAFAACRTRSSLWNTLSRLGVRRVRGSTLFSSASALRSARSAAGSPALLTGIIATNARSRALRRLAFRYLNSVGTRDEITFAAQWLACMLPCRRFADILTDACARLGADVVC
jgi:hypothetical protein